MPPRVLIAEHGHATVGAEGLVDPPHPHVGVDPSDPGRRALAIDERLDPGIPQLAHDEVHRIETAEVRGPQLEVAEVPAQQDQSPPLPARGFEVLQALDLGDRLPGRCQHQLRETRVLGRDTPHLAVVLAQDLLALGLAPLRERSAQIVARDLAPHAEPPRPVAESRSEAERAFPSERPAVVEHRSDHECLDRVPCLHADVRLKPASSAGRDAGPRSRPTRV